MTRYRFLLRLAVAGLCLFALTATAAAQDLGALTDRMDRLERDLTILQRQFYRSQTGGQGAVESPAGPPSAPSAMPPSAAAQFDVRLSTLEEQQRALTGRIEEVSHKIDVLSQRLDKMSADFESRLEALEQGKPGALSIGPNPKAGGAAPAASAGAKGAAGAVGTATASAPKTAGQGPQVAAGQKAAPEVSQNRVVLPMGTPKQQYDYAYSLLQSGDYTAAGEAFQQFVVANPNDGLAANAEYWLGETHFVRNQFEPAAAAFLSGYQKAPKGPKAADNLFKLGVTLGKLGKTKDACVTLAKFEHDFGAASRSLKERAVAERQKLHCR